MSSLLSAQVPTPATPNDPKAWAVKPHPTVTVPLKVSKGSKSLNVTAGGPKAGKGSSGKRSTGKGSSGKRSTGKGSVRGLLCVPPTTVPNGYFLYNGKLLPNSLRAYILMPSDKPPYAIETVPDGEYDPNCHSF